MHQSVATINSPQFINLQPLDINPLMSKCEIKVLYVGQNRNHSFISKEVATEIGKTLRGAPIVGYYKDTKEDFADHGEKVIIDDEGIKFECQTVPYGFVSPDAEVWFQKFNDFDSFGNSVEHQYLMTTGYLWTTQFPESSLPVKEGRPQSMELESNSVKGSWETNVKTNMEFFIINDAIIQKLCILGDDVEPCFEGASVTAPDVSSKFTLDDKFKRTLYSMMKDLQSALKGGQQMNELEKTVVDTELENKESVNDFTENSVTPSENEESSGSIEVQASSSESSTVFEKDQKKEQKKEKEDNKEKDQNDDDVEDEKEDDDKQESAKKYAALEQKLNELSNAYSNLQNQYQELVAFKEMIDNKEKDALIAEFYMLSDEDKQDVIANKSKYSLNDIKSKLSVICFDKKINFNKETSQQPAATATYILNSNESDGLPDWVRAVKEQQRLG